MSIQPISQFERVTLTRYEKVRNTFLNVCTLWHWQASKNNQLWICLGKNDFEGAKQAIKYGAWRQESFPLVFNPDRLAFALSQVKKNVSKTYRFDADTLSNSKIEDERTMFRLLRKIFSTLPFIPSKPKNLSRIKVRMLIEGGFFSIFSKSTNEKIKQMSMNLKLLSDFKIISRDEIRSYFSKLDEDYKDVNRSYSTCFQKFEEEEKTISNA